MTSLNNWCERQLEESHLADKEVGAICVDLTRVDVGELERRDILLRGNAVTRVASDDSVVAGAVLCKGSYTRGWNRSESAWCIAYIAASTGYAFMRS